MYLSLKTLRPLFSIAPMLKSETAAIFLAGFDINAQRHHASRHGAERLFDECKFAADEGKQIGRFREGIVPDREMAIGVCDRARGDQIAVGEQHRGVSDIGFDAGGVDGHYVRPIREIGDAAKALGLALGAIGRARAIETAEVSVCRRVDESFYFQSKRT